MLQPHPCRDLPAEEGRVPSGPGAGQKQSWAQQSEEEEGQQTPTLGAGAVGKLGPVHHPSSPHRAAGQGRALSSVGQHHSC